MSAPPSTPIVSPFIAIDPGKCTGWATFVAHRLERAGTTSIDAPSCPASDALRAQGRGALVIEMPHVYSAGKSKGDPNDLIGVAVEVGRWIERAGSDILSVETFEPSRWKGQIPKSAHHRQALAVLDVYEREIAGPLPTSDTCKAANKWDAIALGLWRLGRLR